MSWLWWYLMLQPSVAPRFWGRLFGPAPPGVQPVQIEARALDRVWTEARVDGDAHYSGWLEPDQSLRVEGQQEVYLWCGRADKLALTINGEPAGTLAAVTDSRERAPAWYTFRNDAAA